MKYALYLGCQIPFVRPDLEVAIREVFSTLGIELVDLEGYSCCPTWISVPSYDVDAWLAISARNISLAEDRNLDIVVGCNNCYSVLNHARYMLNDEKWRERTNRILSKIGRVYRGSSKVFHVVHVLEKVEKKIKKSLKYKLDGLTVAVQPGCHILWPVRVMDVSEENPFYPKELRKLVEILGAKAPHYSRMEFCCGMGSMKTVDYEKSLDFVFIKLKSMKEEIDPDVIVTSCSSCYMHLDEAQQKLERDGKIDFKIPVFYYPQLLAICMGIDPSRVAKISSVPKDEIISRIIG